MKKYTIAQFLEAAKEAEVSEIDAKHICETLESKNHKEVGTFRKMLDHSNHFYKDEIVKVIRVDKDSNIDMDYRCENVKGVAEWLTNDEHEPTNETF